MKRTLVLLTVLSLLTGSSAFAAKNEVSQKEQGFAVYYVDIQKVLNESNKGKQARSILESKVAQANEKIKQMEEEIKKLKEELKNPVLSKQAKAEKENQLQQKIRDLQRFKQDTQLEIMNLEKKYTMEILKEIDKLIKEYRKKNGIPMIVELRTAGIIAADPKYDLTDKIIKLYNEQSGQ
ncbi:OmpH family outer membrane protein [Phorcysia thermohydrogeniphila]|uniref:Periplasmic chaperone for outer membrane proteins Skp n=1 Tax=Phorcysia thermohydrogeniphila TaxID=936138 RepID=A0A4R1GEE0_9BACT|nr:OmpH family outer membrane protein [Phorcysia thermohydrogeniphila]TCK06574.1 periplasmic chaperone for outer membrane proteins Skp [Phorcysia thermohydrogeniphila]